MNQTVSGTLTRHAETCRTILHVLAGGFKNKLSSVRLRVDFFAPRTNLAHMKLVIAGGGSRLLGNNLFLIAFVEP